jgi:hypothetical protein
VTDLAKYGPWAVIAGAHGLYAQSTCTGVKAFGRERVGLNFDAPGLRVTAPAVVGEAMMALTRQR